MERPAGSAAAADSIAARRCNTALSRTGRSPEFIGVVGGIPWGHDHDRLLLPQTEQAREGTRGRPDVIVAADPLAPGLTPTAAQICIAGEARHRRDEQISTAGVDHRAGHIVLHQL